MVGFCGHPEVVDRGSETQPQVGENYKYSVKLNDLDLLFFIELVNTMKYGGGVLNNLVFT